MFLALVPQLLPALGTDKAGAWHSAGGPRAECGRPARGSPSRPWQRRVNKLGKEGAAVIWLRSLVN